ncbi:DoxX family protein [Luteimonas gilva]|uniref:DoxX family protein n=1 Tax=Luteimonas gilva TaxID=2572684 RepID=A0A4U5JT71_9GAMM|nr:DoxX family protein [Luteimonas gilva]TKR33030.1 DoxX family protein [Luteimonas gilva]
MNPVAVATIQAVLAAIVALVLLKTLAARTGARDLGRGFLWVCALLALANLLGVAVVSLAGDGAANMMRPVLRTLRMADWPLTGVALLLACAAWMRKPSAGGTSTIADFASRPETAAGLSVYVALGFFAFEIGKLAHDAQMREFFLNSGYPATFMYAVMAAEIVGAIGLMFERTRRFAALWLAVIMIGAIGTHVRNGDPFSDSLDALRMLLISVSILALSHRSKTPLPSG